MKPSSMISETQLDLSVIVADCGCNSSIIQGHLCKAKNRAFYPKVKALDLGIVPLSQVWVALGMMLVHIPKMALVP